MKNIEAKRKKYEVLMAKQAFNSLHLYTIALKARLKNCVSIDSIQGECRQPINDNNIKDLYEKIYTIVGVKFASDTYATLKPQKSDMSWYWQEYMKRFVQTSLGDRIAQVTKSTYEGIQAASKKAIDQGISEGWGADKIASEIVKNITELEKWRALRIARTEVVSASNRGSIEGAKSTGIRMKKVWLSSNDSRTRDGKDEYNHKAMNGVEVEMNEKFLVLGNGVNDDYLEYPGDPNGEASNVINCRCTQIYKPY